MVLHRDNEAKDTLACPNRKPHRDDAPLWLSGSSRYSSSRFSEAPESWDELFSPSPEGSTATPDAGSLQAGVTSPPRVGPSPSPSSAPAPSPSPSSAYPPPSKSSLQSADEVPARRSSIGTGGPRRFFADGDVTEAPWGGCDHSDVIGEELSSLRRGTGNVSLPATGRTLHLACDTQEKTLEWARCV